VIHFENWIVMEQNVFVVMKETINFFSLVYNKLSLKIIYIFWNERANKCHKGPKTNAEYDDGLARVPIAQVAKQRS
jgi:hypothetical protein